METMYMDLYGFIKPQNLKHYDDSAVSKLINALTLILDERNAKIDATMASNHLTKAGKEAKVAELNMEANVAIGEVGKDVSFEALTEQINREMKPSDLKTGDPVMDYLQQKEYRDHLRGLDPLEVQVLYRAATESGDDPLLEAAVENAPPQMPLVEAEIIDQGKLLRSMRINPALVEKMEDADQLQHARDYNLQIARTAIQMGKDDDAPAKPHFVSEGDLILSGSEGGQ